MSFVLPIIVTASVVGVVIGVGWYSVWYLFLKDCKLIRELQKEFLNPKPPLKKTEVVITRSGIQFDRIYDRWMKSTPIIKFPSSYLLVKPTLPVVREALFDRFIIEEYAK